MRRPFPSTMTVLAILEVPLSYDHDQLAELLEDTNLDIDRAVVLGDRRVSCRPIRQDRRGSYTRAPVLKLTPAEKARAF